MAGGGVLRAEAPERRYRPAAGEGRSIATEIDIAAAPERVWEVLMDFAAYPDWNPMITSISGDPATGSRLEARL